MLKGGNALDRAKHSMRDGERGGGFTDRLRCEKSLSRDVEVVAHPLCWISFGSEHLCQGLLAQLELPPVLKSQGIEHVRLSDACRKRTEVNLQRISQSDCNGLT